MRAWGFLVSRRWILFAITVGLLAWAAWWLGEWQFDRLEERKARNAIIERNESAPPAQVPDVMPVDGEVTADDEWRMVTATGQYAVDDTVIVRYRTRDGVKGVDVVVPLVLDGGLAVLVDRGWLATDSGTIERGRGACAAAGRSHDDRLGAPRRNRFDSTAVSDGSTRAISSDQIGEALDREVYDGFVDLRSEDPEPADPLEPRGAARPRQRAALLLRPAVVVLRRARALRLRLPGVGRAARTEIPARRTSASERAEHAPVDREHHAGHE